MTSQTERLLNSGIAFQEMLVMHPRLTQTHQRLDELRALGRATRGKPQKILPIIGPSGSGKTTNFKTWRDGVATSVLPGSNSPPAILHVTLSAKCSVKQLGADILQALGQFGLPVDIVDDLRGRQRGRRTRLIDPFHDLKDAVLMYAAAVALDNAGIELLAIDELHHLIDKDQKGKIAWTVSEALKVLADMGVCPVAVIGTSTAMRIVSAKNNPQFAARCAAPVMLDPLDITLKGDRTLFIGYIASLSKLLIKHGVFDEDQGLTREDFVACFYDVSRGVVGTVSRLVDNASAIAIREGKDRIGREHLSEATRTWAMPMDLTDHDPWMKGPRDLKLLKKVH
ncbi:TniB family NTP-binding protein [Lichenifustis flavocetrariae]|uniref:TniB family NTP-binding protein n=1 Tax=Lichenifustis flavocetrariae TaxID=2949735 RepID=A0AA41YZB4_9HYPH|nr:TniB family NTP-binding protein [Lichenifustis flavocetrariae]MCW6509868.1 TniB family NTP-binding protein [Lichenifustis flavocetrariae]